MKQLRISPELALPLDAVTQKLAWLGRTGSGKTYGASKLAEEMLAAEAQVVIIDAVGVWYGLRLAADGKGAGVEIPVFGGLHGDVPLEPTGGALMANLIVDRGISVVLDVSQFETDSAKARFAHEWGDRFFFRKKAAPSAVHVFIEECQEFVPQNPQKGEERMLHAFQRLEKLGRNFGIGVSLISQRPQEVNKKALNQTECLFVFQMTGTQERKAIEAWIADKDLDEDVSDMLPRLKVGEAHVWSPQWLEISKTVRIAPKRTFNASSTPTVGGRAQARELAPIDLARIRKDMAATIERAKAEDPRELKRRIAELERELKAKPTAAPAKELKRVEVPILKDAQVKRLEVAVDRARSASATLLRAHAHQVDQLSQRLQVFVSEAGLLQDQIKAAVAAARDEQARVSQRSVGAGRPGGLQIPARTGAAGDPSRPAPVIPRGNGKVHGGVEQRILNALAELEQMGAARPGREMVAFLAGYTHLQSKGFVNAMSALRTNGLLDYPDAGTVALTSEGRSQARSPERPRTAAELQERVISMLGGASARILTPLIEAYPQTLARETVAAKAGYGHLQSKGFVNAISRLRTLGFVDYPGRGSIVATPVLFLEGTA